MLALVATLAAKIAAALELETASVAKVLSLVLLLDLVVYLGLIAGLALVESRWRFAKWVTIPIAAVVAVLGLANAAYLFLAGEQGSLSAIEGAVQQADDIQMVLSSLTSPLIITGIAGAVLVFATLPVLLGWLVRRARGDVDRRRHGHARFNCAWSLAAPAALAAAVLPGPDSVDARALSRNALVNIVRATTIRSQQGSFAGYAQKRMVAQPAIDELAIGRRPNVLIVFLESTRYDHTSLAPADIRKAETPRLAALAERGVSAPTMRAVLPHTTKSMFSMLCGRLPTMQRGVIEVSHDGAFQCVPDIASEAGYRTYFSQSAFGTFEQRPRLVEKFGYAAFTAWEDIQAPVLGYLASEDASVVDPFLAWLDSTNQSAPFFATILTSATHHPYRLSQDLRDRVRASGKPQSTVKDRYARLVEEEDVVLGTLLDALESRGLIDDTIVLAVGDHGEGFGDHGVRQHDNNYFEEGLRVPFVLAGPGIERGEIDGNASLIDIAPTLLARLGLSLVDSHEPWLGHDLLSPSFDTRGEPRFFGCYSPMRCRGFVLDDYKLVYVPENDEIWAFNLAKDPDEREPLVPNEALWDHVPQLNQLIDGHRVKGWKQNYQEVKYGEWLCPKRNNRCKHPNAKDAKHRRGPGKKKTARAPKGTRAAVGTGPAEKPGPAKPASGDAAKPDTAASDGTKPGAATHSEAGPDPRDGTESRARTKPQVDTKPVGDEAGS